MTNERFTTVNVSDYSENNMAGMAESDLRQAVSEFSSIDRHVEAFLKNSAEEFSRQHK